MDRFIAPWFRWLLIAALAGYVVHMLIGYGRSIERQACRLEKTTQAATSSEQIRADEGATSKAQKEGADDQIEAIRTLVEQRNAADLAAGRLRQQVAATVRAATECGAPNDSAPESSRTAVAALGAVLEACDREQRELAQAASGHLIAGQRCEAEYDALTP